MRSQHCVHPLTPGDAACGVYPEPSALFDGQGGAGQDPEAPPASLAAEEIRVTAASYHSLPAALDSDHKPVVAVLDVSMPVTDQARRRPPPDGPPRAAAPPPARPASLAVVTLGSGVAVPASFRSEDFAAARHPYDGCWMIPSRCTVAIKWIIRIYVSSYWVQASCLT